MIGGGRAGTGVPAIEGGVLVPARRAQGRLCKKHEQQIMYNGAGTLWRPNGNKCLQLNVALLTAGGDA